MPIRRRNNNRHLFLSLISLAIFIFSGAVFAGESILNRSSSFKRLNAKVIRKISIPKGYHEGLSIDGNIIYIANGENGKIWVIDKQSGELVDEITPLSDFTEGISKRADGLFFVSEWYDKKIYISRLKGGRLVEESRVSFSPAHPAGILWNGERLFVLAWTRGIGTKFDLVQLDLNLNLIDKTVIKDIQEPTQMAWDGKFLWIASWYDQNVYKVDLAANEIVSGFRSPAAKTTGIAWDGRRLWLTGTYSDLYELEIS